MLNYSLQTEKQCLLPEIKRCIHNSVLLKQLPLLVGLVWEFPESFEVSDQQRGMAMRILSRSFVV